MKVELIIIMTMIIIIIIIIIIIVIIIIMIIVNNNNNKQIWACTNLGLYTNLGLGWEIITIVYKSRPLGMGLGWKETLRNTHGLGASWGHMVGGLTTNPLGCIFGLLSTFLGLEVPSSSRHHLRPASIA